MTEAVHRAADAAPPMPSGPIRNFERSGVLNRRLHALIPAGSHTYSKGEDQFPLRSPEVIAGGRRLLLGRGWQPLHRLGDGKSGDRPGSRLPGGQRGGKAADGPGLNFTRPRVLEYELAEYLVDLLPVAEMVKFGKNGSDVTTAAVKLAGHIPAGSWSPAAATIRSSASMTGSSALLPMNAGSARRRSASR